MIRLATPDDVPALLALGERMHADSNFASLAWDAAKMSALIEQLIGMPGGFVRVYVADGEVRGGMLAMACPHWCSADLVATDLALYVEPDSRGGLGAARLLAAYVGWAQVKGAKMIQFGAVAPRLWCEVERIAKLAERVGFRRQGVVLCV